MIRWHIGCSGFHYKHWKEIFYPVGLPQKKWFDHYCENFNTLELNVTFYRFPEPSFVHNWYKKSPESFLFAVKAPRLITHYKKFNDSKELVNDFYKVISDGLKNKLGCVLFQLPPGFDYSEERLQKIIGNLDLSFSNVLEFRNKSWWNTAVFDELKKNNITFCGMSHPMLPDTILHNNQLVYHRMHGVPFLYKSLYSKDELRKIISEIKSSPGIQEVFIYFNNDVDGSAIINAKQMIELTLEK
jgi:uncharacterized protein YecE (DUF72 family)